MKQKLLIKLERVADSEAVFGPQQDDSFFVLVPKGTKDEMRRAALHETFKVTKMNGRLFRVFLDNEELLGNF